MEEIYNFSKDMTINDLNILDDYNKKHIGQQKFLSDFKNVLNKIYCINEQYILVTEDDIILNNDSKDNDNSEENYDNEII